jgi:hypothetical protein
MIRPFGSRVGPLEAAGLGRRPMMRTLLGVLMLAVTLTAAGAVGRRALHLNDGPLVGWRCARCGAGNADDPNQSFRAVCRVCSHRCPWDDLAAVTGGSAGRSAAVAR